MGIMDEGNNVKFMHTRAGLVLRTYTITMTVSMEYHKEHINTRHARTRRVQHSSILQKNAKSEKKNNIGATPSIRERKPWKVTCRISLMQPLRVLMGHHRSSVG